MTLIDEFWLQSMEANQVNWRCNVSSPCQFSLCRIKFRPSGSLTSIGAVTFWLLDCNSKICITQKICMFS